MNGNQQVWIDRLTHCGALSIHDGKSETPHSAVGYHSDIVVKPNIILERARLLDQASANLNQLLRNARCDTSIHRLVSVESDMRFAHSLAGQLGCLSGVWQNRYNRSGETTLVSLSIITKLYFSRLYVLFEATRIYKISLAPYLVTLINLSGREEVAGMPIIALVNREMRSWEKSTDCELCQLGSKPVDYAYA